MKKIARADLHMHGPIGFQHYWLKLQCYEGKNLLQELAETCFARGIDCCAITSVTHEEIKKGGVHDRFGYLVNEARNLPVMDYRHDKKGDVILTLEKDGTLVHFVNSQTVVCYVGDRRVDHLVIGTNQVPNNKQLEDTINFCRDNGLPQIAEHPFLLAHFGVGEDTLEKFVENYDAIEGHNSQLIFPRFMKKLPAFGKYTREANEQAREFARKHGKSWIAVSDAHRVEDAGISYIEFSDLDLSDEDRFLSGLRALLRNGNFTPVCNYESLTGFFDWTLKFKKGMKEYYRNPKAFES